jgi:hypothetical protein
MPLFIPQDSVKQSSPLCSWILEFSLSYHHHHHLFFYSYRIISSPLLPPPSHLVLYSGGKAYLFYILPVQFLSSSLFYSNLPPVYQVFSRSPTLILPSHFIQLAWELVYYPWTWFRDLHFFLFFALTHHLHLHHHHQLGDAESYVHITYET